MPTNLERMAPLNFAGIDHWQKIGMVKTLIFPREEEDGVFELPILEN